MEISTTCQSSSAGDENNKISVIDIILIGLEFLIPLMNHEILKVISKASSLLLNLFISLIVNLINYFELNFSSFLLSLFFNQFQPLCIEYYKLISNTAYSNSEKLFTRTFELFSILINSIQYGLTSNAGLEVIRLSLECIIPLCNRIFASQLQQTNYGLSLRNLFKVVFNLIFQNSFEIDLFEVSSNALYSLICCYQDTYTMLVNDLVAQYDDEQLKAKILSGFQALTPTNFIFSLDKRNRLKFNSKFNDFCIKTYGLLFIR